MELKYQLEMEIRTVNVTQYITPLREGGSLPAIVAADDDFKYVLKFKGAGHREKALISEYLGCEIARKLGFKVPELVFANLDEAFGRTEADEEIQDLLRGSHGLNLGLHYLSGAINFDPVVTTVDENVASGVVWLDAFLTNIDRTFRNTNMLIWNKELWLIDHGASLYFHHTWNNWEKLAISSFPYVKDHVLLPRASDLESIDKAFKQVLSEEVLRDIVNSIPSEWMPLDERELSPEEQKEIYFLFLKIRLANTELFINEANNARNGRI